MQNRKQLAAIARRKLHIAYRILKKKMYADENENKNKKKRKKRIHKEICRALEINA